MTYPINWYLKVIPTINWLTENHSRIFAEHTYTDKVGYTCIYSLSRIKKKMFHKVLETIQK